MEHVRRNERLIAMTKSFFDSPNEIITLGVFCEMFSAAKSSLSEDLNILREIFNKYEFGKIETIAGASGGAVYRPAVPSAKAHSLVMDAAKLLSAPGRLLPGGYIYTGDILGDPRYMDGLGAILAQRFYNNKPDFILTMETRGVPIAMAAARHLGCRLVIARRDNQTYEGPAVHIQYVSGNKNVLGTMWLPRRAITRGKTAVIIDDMIRSGSTINGMKELMDEFEIDVTGIGILLDYGYERAFDADYSMLLKVENLNDELRMASVVPA